MAQNPPELMAGIQTKSLECCAVAADANHRVFQELVGLSAAAAKEGLRTASELQSALLEASRATIPGPIPDASGSLEPSPLAWYRQGLTMLVDSTQKTVRLLETNGQVLTRGAERLQACMERSNQELQQALTTSVSRVREICGRS